MLNPTESATVASAFGVAEAQVKRDHLISHVLHALATVNAPVVFFGGTALARRQEAARVAVALGEAEQALEHVSITRAKLAGHGTVAEPAQGIDVLEHESARGGVGEPAQVPVWRTDLAEAHLPVGYRRLWLAVRDAAEPGRAQELARGLGLEPTPGKVEALRSKLKRLVARGWIAEPAPGVFAAAGGKHTAYRARRRAMTSVIAHKTMASSLSARRS
jgi:hypothetical protein